jgi:hypothetical protein
MFILRTTRRGNEREEQGEGVNEIQGRFSGGPGGE